MRAGRVRAWQEKGAGALLGEKGRLHRTCQQKETKGTGKERTCRGEVGRGGARVQNGGKGHEEGTGIGRGRKRRADCSRRGQGRGRRTKEDRRGAKKISAKNFFKNLSQNS